MFSSVFGSVCVVSGFVVSVCGWEGDGGGVVYVSMFTDTRVSCVISWYVELSCVSGVLVIWDDASIESFSLLFSVWFMFGSRLRSWKI